MQSRQYVLGVAGLAFVLGVLILCAIFFRSYVIQPGNDGKPAPSFKVTVDRNLRPNSRPLARFSDEVVRPIATLIDKSGKQTDFVENELIVEFATQQALTIFLAKWHGTVLATDRPTAAGINANPTYLLRIQTDNENVSTISDDLSQVNPRGGSSIAVSSEAARRLIAAGAHTAADGVRVGINFLTKSTGFKDETLTEAAMSSNKMYGDDKSVVENWNPNPFQWVYMKRGGNLDIGVASAWRVLERLGAFKNKVEIAVIDGGFGTGDDFPTPYEFDKASFAALDPTGRNEVSCSGDADCP